MIAIVESPSVPVNPESRGRLKALVLGVVLAWAFGAVLAVALELAQRRRSDGDAEANDFASTLEEVKGEVLRPVRWVKSRVGR